MTIGQKNLAELFADHRQTRYAQTVTIADNEDVSGGIIAELYYYLRWTIFIKTQGDVELTVEMSPDDGNTWYEIPDSPLSYGEATDHVIEFGYDADKMRITANTSTAVTAQIKGIV